MQNNEKDKDSKEKPTPAAPRAAIYLRAATREQFTADPRRAATYARMSTDQREYSVENQMAAIMRYAAPHPIQS